MLDEETLYVTPMKFGALHRPAVQSTAGERWLFYVHDTVALAALCVTVFLLRFTAWPQRQDLAGDLMLLLALGNACFYLFNTAALGERSLGMSAAARIWIATTALGLLITTFLFFVGERPTNLFGRTVLPGALVAFAIEASLVRIVAARFWVDAERPRWLVLANSDTLVALDRDLARTSLAAELLAQCSGDKDSPVLAHIRVLPTARMQAGVTTAGCTGVVIADPNELSEEALRALVGKKLNGLPTYDLVSFYEHFCRKLPVFSLTESWLVASQGFRLIQSRVSLRMKNLMGSLAAVLLLPLLAPIMLLTAIAVALTSGFPVIFRQVRVGRNGDEFTLYKFRTMRRDAEADGARWATAGDPRVTRLGRFLRTFRLDELPQLWNVLRGEMAFIGPRPERPEFTQELSRLIPFYDLRHVVRPGITGWAQVLYDYGNSVEDARQKLQFDLYYIKNYSIFLDARIIARTLRRIVSAVGL